MKYGLHCQLLNYDARRDNEELMGGGRSRGLLIVSRNMRLSNNDFVSAQLVIDLDMHPFVSIFLQENKT